MKILAISKFFPPNGSARALQIDKVLKAICQTGCQVHVIAGLSSIETSKLSVTRDNLPYTLRYVLFDPPREGKSFVGRFWHRLLCEFSSANPVYKWVRRTLYETMHTVESYKPDVVLTSSSSFESHLVGLHLKNRVGLPWVASFSDPWPSHTMPFPHNAYKMPVLTEWQMFLLRSVLRKCDGIHMPNRHALKLIGKKTQLSISEKCYSIPHVGSKVDIDSEQYEKGWLAHIGHLSRQRLSKPLLEAVKISASNYPKDFKGLLLVGTVCREFHALAKKMNMGRLVKIMGHMPSEKAMLLAAQSEALLVVEADMPKSPFLPSKFADYTFVDRPIIAITPPISPIREYLSACGGGYPVSHNTEEISNAIHKVFCNRSELSKTFCIDSANVLKSNFSSESVGAKYLHMFRSVLHQDSPQ